MKISDWMRSIWYGLENLWAYKKLIWRDRNWEYEYLYELMEFKLKRMANLHRKYGCCVDSEEVAAEIEEAAECLRKVRLEETSVDIRKVGTANYYDRHLQELTGYLKRFGELFEKSQRWWD